MENYFYETPKDVADLLATHVPHKVNNLLEPAVGAGALLKAILSSQVVVNKITAIDVNKDILRSTKKILTNFYQSDHILINDDFIQWSINMMQKNKKYDCIVMNPPFCSKKEKYITLSAKENKKVSLETAFIYLAMNLLNNQGRMIAIVPGSIVSSDSNNWLRQEMFKKGSISLVHELPRFTFPGIESKIYLIVYENNKSNKKIKFLNNSINNSSSFAIKKNELCNSFRLDYGYINSKKIVDKFISNSDLNWIKLSDISIVFRGDYDGFDKKINSLHSTDFLNGFWFSDLVKKIDIGNRYVLKGDIVIKRIGRNCLSSAGIYVTDIKSSCSDCVFVVRAKSFNKRFVLLFALRCWIKNINVKKMLQKGTGATYITYFDLSNLLLPFNLNRVYPKHYRNYVQAINIQDIKTLEKIESEVANLLQIV